jgi:hypothetical protein
MVECVKTQAGIGRDYVALRHLRASRKAKTTLIESRRI